MLLKSLVLIVALFVPVSLMAQAKLTENERAVKYFNLDEGFSSQLGSKLISQYIALTDEQEKEIRETKAKALKEATAVKSKTSLGAEKQLAKLVEIRKRQNDGLREVLLPFQKERLQGFPHYVVILKEGFANSAVNGLIAIQLNLSKNERRKVRDEASIALKDYKEELVVAQKKAIARIRSSLPKEKQKALDDFIEQMLLANDTLWPVEDKMLDPSNKGTFSFSRLPPIDRE